MVYQLCFPTTLYQGLPPAIPCHSLHVVGQARSKAGKAHEPEHQPKRETYALFKRRRLVFQVEGDNNSDGDDGEVGRQPQP